MSLPPSWSCPLKNRAEKVPELALPKRIRCSDRALQSPIGRASQRSAHDQPPERLAGPPGRSGRGPRPGDAACLPHARTANSSRLRKCSSSTPATRSCCVLSSLPAGDPLGDLVIEQIYEDALLIEGLHPDPAGMIERIQKLMEAAIRQPGDDAG